MRVLLTGAAGFIGSRISSALTARGHEVIAVDAMLPAAHQEGSAPPEGCTLVDIRDGDALAALLPGVDVVCHQAAVVGAGVNALDAPSYALHNDAGTATLLAEMYRTGVQRLVLASSMVVYGQGAYTCATHGAVDPAPRTRTDLDAGRFEHRCPIGSEELSWQLVGEDAPLRPRSLYAASKVAQEHYALAWADVSTGQTAVLDIAADAITDELARLEPAELLVSDLTLDALREMGAVGLRRVSLLNLAEHIIRLWGPPPKPRKPAVPPH